MSSPHPLQLPLLAVVGLRAGDEGARDWAGGVGDTRRLPEFRGGSGRKDSCGGPIGGRPLWIAGLVRTSGASSAGSRRGGESIGLEYIGLLKLGGGPRRLDVCSSAAGVILILFWNPSIIPVPWCMSDDRRFACCGELGSGGVDRELPLLASEPEDSLDEVDSVGV